MLVKRFFTSSGQMLAKFKVYAPENTIRNRSLVEAIGESRDQTAFFAWHPKKEIPYEFTR